MEIASIMRTASVLIAMQLGLTFSSSAQGQSGIVPPKLSSAKTEVKIAGVVEQRAVGGGGRYLALTIPTLRQVAIFDVNQAKVVKYLPADDSEIHVAAGKDKLVIVLGTKKIAFRYSLQDFSRELTTNLDIPSGIARVCMGASSDGPLVIARKGRQYNAKDYQLSFLDLKNLTPISMSSNEGNVYTNEWKETSILDATADGNTFLLHGSMVVQIVEGVLRRVGGQAHGNSLRYGRICPKGKFVYASGAIFTPELSPLGKPAQGSYVYDIMIPGCEGNYYLNCNTGDQNFSNREKSKATVGLHLSGENSPLVKLDGIDLYEGGSPRRHPAHPPGFEKSLFFVPSGNTLIQIPLSNDKLIVHRVDVDELLEKSGVDFLFVRSQAPSKAKPGETFQYKIDVKSKAGGLKYELVSSPEGMKIGRDGQITWPIPKDFSYTDASIIAQISDKSSQQVLHTFRVETGGKGGTAPDAVKTQVSGQVVSTDFSKLPPIKPLAMQTKEQNVQLPAAFDDIRVGGGGRYLILKFKSLKKLGVFDVCEGKVIHYIPIPDVDCGYAAGANRLVIVSPAKGVVSRYQIATGKRELTRTFASGVVAHVFMGSASGGPAYVSTSQQRHSATLDRMNLSDLTPVPVKFDGHASRGFSPRARVKISSNGQTMAVWETGVSPSGLQTYIKQGESWKSHYEHDSVGSIVPSADGSLIFTHKGIFTSQLAPKKEEQGYGYSPATMGDFYLRQTMGDRSGNSQPGKSSLHKVGDDRPLLTLDFGANTGPDDIWGRGILTLEQRLIFVPGANVIVVVPRTRDSLVLKRFDLDTELNASGVDYLFVLSHASGTVKLGENYQHQIEVKSKSGGVTCKMESGPEGMSISSSGKITWSVPADFEGESSTVIVSIGDKSGQEVFHTFKLDISGATERIQAMRAEAEQKKKLELEQMRIAEEQKRKKMREEQERANERMRLQREKSIAERTANRTKWLSIKEKAIAEDDATKKNITPPVKYEQRTWTDTGGSTIEASYVQVFAGSIILRLNDGSQIAIPGSRLAETDRTYATNAYRTARDADQKIKELELARKKRQGDPVSRQQLERESVKKMQQISNSVRQRTSWIETGSFDAQSKTPMLSWRVHVLPFLGHAELHQQFHLDEPWFSEHNRTLIAKMPDIFKAPGSAADAGKTNYLAVVAPESFFVHPGQRRFGSMRRSGNQGMFVEVGDHKAVTWTRPDELQVNLGGSNTNMRHWFGQRDDGMLIAFNNGEVRKLLSGNDLQTAAKIFSKMPADSTLKFAIEAPESPMKDDLEKQLFGQP